MRCQTSNKRGQRQHPSPSLPIARPTMAVLLETSRGDLAVDLFVDECPLASKNFLKLCKIKYYNNCLFHKASLPPWLPRLPAPATPCRGFRPQTARFCCVRQVVKDFIVQTGDPTGKGSGGSSIYGVMYGDQVLRPTLHLLRSSRSRTAASLSLCCH